MVSIIIDFMTHISILPFLSLMRQIPNCNRKTRVSPTRDTFTNLPSSPLHKNQKERGALPFSTSSSDLRFIFSSKRKKMTMFPEQWTPPCGSKCTKKYAALTQIPWRVFCKKGCNTDVETFEDCLGECDEICYKDPVFKDHQWSSYIDRSPGSDSYSVECFRACVAGCGYKFDLPREEVDKVQPKRPPKPCVGKKPPKPIVEQMPTSDDMVSNSA